MKISTITVFAIAVFAAGCASTQEQVAAEDTAEQVVVAQVEVAEQDATSDEQMPETVRSRRGTCPGGYAPTGTRIKRCTRVGVQRRSGVEPRRYPDRVSQCERGSR